jgi:hypothetical protein
MTPSLLQQSESEDFKLPFRSVALAWQLALPVSPLAKRGWRTILAFQDRFPRPKPEQLSFSSADVEQVRLRDRCPYLLPAKPLLAQTRPSYGSQG